MRLLLFAGLTGAVGLLAQTSPKPEPDVLIFTDGEKLIGQLKRSNDKSVTFKSDMAGEVTVDWSKIKELHSSQKFAVIKTNVILAKHPDTSAVPQGTVSMADQKIEVSPGEGRPAQTIPVADAAHVVTAPDFQKAIENPRFTKDWKGALTGGISLVEATQKSQTFFGGFNFVRAIPTVDWLDPRNRTMVDFNTSYGKVTQPGTPTVKTEIFHAGAERDEYFSQSLYAFGQLSFDHNFSQGLDLQQNYGGGMGWAAIKDDDQELDLKASLTYVRQSFQNSKKDNLVGATIAENYNHKFRHDILLVEQLAITPAFNDADSWTATGNSSLTIPFYKRLNFAIGVVDSFLNNPPAGFKKNSFQFTTGVTYRLP